MRYLFILALVGLAACAMKTPFTGPDGRQAYSLRCPPISGGIGGCYQQAGQLCPAGYDVIDGRSSTVGTINSTGGVIASQQTLTFQCR